MRDGDNQGERERERGGDRQRDRDETEKEKGNTCIDTKPFLLSLSVSQGVYQTHRLLKTK